MVDRDEMAAFGRAVGYVLHAERQRQNWTLARSVTSWAASVGALPGGVGCSITGYLDMQRFVGLCSVLEVARRPTI